jgi:hypothetical protein
MEWTASVSLESDTQPVKTHRTQISALRPQTAASRAIREAQQAFKGAHYRSLVVVLEKQASEPSR